jgi:hypothetical protein
MYFKGTITINLFLCLLYFMFIKIRRSKRWTATSYGESFVLQLCHKHTVVYFILKSSN